MRSEVGPGPPRATGTGNHEQPQPQQPLCSHPDIGSQVVPGVGGEHVWHGAQVLSQLLAEQLGLQISMVASSPSSQRASFGVCTQLPVAGSHESSVQENASAQFTPAHRSGVLVGVSVGVSVAVSVGVSVGVRVAVPVGVFVLVGVSVRV